MGREAERLERNWNYLMPLSIGRILRSGTFGQRWVSFSPEQRARLRLAFIRLQVRPELATRRYHFRHQRPKPADIHVIDVDGCSFVLAEEIATGRCVLLDGAPPGFDVASLDEVVPSLPEMSEIELAQS